MDLSLSPAAQTVARQGLCPAAPSPGQDAVFSRFRSP